MRFRALLSLLLLLTLASCSNVNTKPTVSPAQQAAEASFRQAEQLSLAFAGADTRERVGIARQIQEVLATLGNDDLARRSAALPFGHPLYAFAGRELLRRGLPLPRPLENLRGDIAAAFPPADRDGYRPPARIGVLLPMSGPLASAGNSVRDGFLAGYYGEGRRRPQVRFHDTAAGLDKAVAEAARAGAQLLVGPLGREEVQNLLADGNARLPMLLLNRPQNLLPDNNMSFALAPEDEGYAAAERLLVRGLRNVVVFGQRDDSSQRARASFRELMQSRGGKILSEIDVPENQGDLSTAINNAKAHSGQAQAIFFALKAPPARILAAQLKTSEFAALPRLATSLILSGGANARLDAELDGIQFPELPWLLEIGSGLPEADSLGKQLNTARGTSQRLFAFGFDAWKLVGYFDKLNNNPGATINGVTGELGMDSQGIVQRKPAWAVFSGGHPRRAPDITAASDGARGN